jgi:hypothetical protein
MLVILLGHSSLLIEKWLILLDRITTTQTLKFLIWGRKMLFGKSFAEQEEDLYQWSLKK